MQRCAGPPSPPTQYSVLLRAFSAEVEVTSQSYHVPQQMMVEVAVPPHRHDIKNSSRMHLCIRGFFAARHQLDFAWLHPVQDSEVDIACDILGPFAG
jgi:hypothetical protein